MRCPDIDHVTFSPRSRDAIENIRKVDKFSMALQRVTAGGVVVNIFAGNGALESSYAVGTTDFKTMAQALAAMPQIARRRISNIAQEAALYVNNPDERHFWHAVVDGCKP